METGDWLYKPSVYLLIFIYIYFYNNRIEGRALVFKSLRIETWAARFKVNRKWYSWAGTIVSIIVTDLSEKVLLNIHYNDAYGKYEMQIKLSELVIVQEVLRSANMEHWI